MPRKIALTFWAILQRLKSGGNLENAARRGERTRAGRLCFFESRSPYGAKPSASLDTDETRLIDLISILL
jgi:hypothetical protein